MGVDYSAVVAYGKLFKDAYEVEEFLEDNLPLTEEDVRIIEEDGVSEFLYDNEFVGGGSLNLDTEGGYYVGYDLSCSCPESFQKDFDEAKEKWDKYFPNELPQMIKTVKVY